MKIFYDFDHLGEIRNAVVTTGSFDGVHIGHKVILQRLKKLAAEIEGETVLITFHPHPRKVLYPETAGKGLLLINSQREKINLLQKAGLDNLIIVTFTLEFSKITSVEFVRNILLNKLHARKIVIGFNHHFGHNREGDYDYLHELGKYYDFAVEEIPEQDIHNEFVSSTKIRKAILEGNIQRANAYLDHEYFFIAPIKPASDVLMPMGIQWFELIPEEEEKQITPPGVYAGSVLEDDRRIKVMVLIEETAQGSRILLNAPEYDLSVLPEVNLAFHKKIRLTAPGESGFDKSLLIQDIEDIRDLIY